MSRLAEATTVGYMCDCGVSRERDELDVKCRDDQRKASADVARLTDVISKLKQYVFIPLAHERMAALSRSLALSCVRQSLMERCLLAHVVTVCGYELCSRDLAAAAASHVDELTKTQVRRYYRRVVVCVCSVWIMACACNPKPATGLKMSSDVTAGPMAHHLQRGCIVLRFDGWSKCVWLCSGRSDEPMTKRLSRSGQSTSK